MTRPMLLARALRVRALGSSDLDTSPLIVGIMGVLIIVVPAPSAKVSISNTVVVVRPTRVRIPSSSRYCKHVCTCDKKYASPIKNIR